MSVLQAQDISISFGDRRVLDKVSLPVMDRARIALAGANGSGKSTFLKILARGLSPDSGIITQKNNTTIGYLSQDLLELTGSTVYECAELAFSTMHKSYKKTEELSLRASQADEKLAIALLHEQEEILEFLRHHGYFDREQAIGRILLGLGFSKNDLAKPVKSFSGGWQMRISLAIILLQKPDILLLDEPTNYLDIETREWLLDWIRAYEGAIILVSHDRFILDELVTEVAEIYRSKLTLYKGSYSDYERAREMELAELLATYKKQEARIENLTRFIERFGAKATKASQANSRKKELEKIERVEIPDGLKKIDFDFPLAPPSGETVIRTTGLSKTYPGKRVLDQFDLDIIRGQKIALLGPNGAGKSTLLHILAGVDTKFEGDLQLGHNVVRSFFAQEQISQLNPEHTILEELEAHASIDQLPNLRTMLGAFLFEDDDVFKEVSVLSGGERSRLALAKMLLKKANLLILDEPTNHLDLSSKDALARALKSYGGTVIFVSHDKYFIKELASRIFFIEPNEGNPSKLTIYEGDYEYFSWKRAGIEPAVLGSSSPIVKVQTQNQLDREEGKKKKSQLKKLEKQEEDLLSELEKLEAELGLIHEQFGKSEVYGNPELLKSLKQKETDLDRQLGQKQSLWESLSQEIELLGKE